MLLLVQAGATGARPAPAASSTASATAPCARLFRVAFVTDVAGLRSAVEAVAWQGIRAAASDDRCLQADVISSAYPADYRRNLQAAADRHSDLIIAGSFLLSDAVLDAAVANPGTHFVLVDPLVRVAAPSNLAVITFREEEAGYLAGALAGLTTRTGVVAGVYGLEDDHDRRYRLGYERGAHDVNGSVRTLGAYQGVTDGPPYASPSWAEGQARAFVDQGADVVFGSGDGTGHGALLAATEAGRSCITVAFEVDPTGPACLIATVLLHVDRAVASVTRDASSGRWQGGERSYGVADGAIEISLSPNAPLTPDGRRRLRAIAGLLAARPI